MTKKNKIKTKWYSFKNPIIRLWKRNLSKTPNIHKKPHKDENNILLLHSSLKAPQPVLNTCHVDKNINTELRLLSYKLEPDF